MSENQSVAVIPEFDSEKFKSENMDKYAEKYSEKGLFKKVKGVVKSGGLSLIYKAFQLFYVTQNPNCPMKVKAGIFAALGYFITPLDMLPDFIPIAGYSDDGASIALAIAVAHIYIDDTVKQKAKDRIKTIFGEEVAAKLN